VLLVLLVLVISYASSLRAWLSQRDDIAAARAELVETNRRVQDLQTGIERWKDPAYVRNQARQRLGFVLPGEVGYNVLGADGEPIGSELSLDEPVVEPKEEVETDWYSSVWGSVQEAGALGEDR
jgi:hypothetical protein